MNKNMRIAFLVAVLAALLTAVVTSMTLAEIRKDRFLDIREIKTPAGITVWFFEDHTLPIVAVNFAFAGAGTINDPPEKQGLAKMLSNTLDEGAGDLDSRAFQKELADHSIGFGFSASRDHFSGSMKFLSREKTRAFDLLALALTKPRFDDDAIQRMRDANIVRIRSSLTDPDWRAARIMNDRAYEGHPYAMNSGGTVSGLQSITGDDLRSFLKDNITRDRLLVAVAGDLSEAEAKAFIDSAFSGLPAQSAGKKPENISIRNTGKTFLMKNDSPQTIIMMAQDGIDRTDPDWYAAQIMNFILGSSGFGSRLMEEVREKRGLTYGIYTSLDTQDHARSISLSTSTRNEKTAEMLELIRAEWVKMRDADITEDELTTAKSYITGSMPLALSSTDRISGMMLSMMLDHLPSTYLDTLADKINAVTISDIRRVSGRILNPDTLLTVLVGMPQGTDNATIVETLPNVE